MRCAHPAPTTGNGNKYVRKLCHEFGLHLWGKHKVSIALLLMGKRREDAAADAEVPGAHVRAFFSNPQN